jgi:hypothetical protein
VQAHWPAPLYPALAICAAIAAGRPDANVFSSPWRLAHRAAPITGLALYPILITLLLIPTAITSRLLAPVIGWPTFARHLEGLRTANQAGWIGTTSYGLAAQLSDEPSLRAPVMQITERARYETLRLPLPDLSRPGLVVDLQRRIDETYLRGCFRHVSMLPPYSRVEHSPPGKTYRLFLVSEPQRNIIHDGC